MTITAEIIADSMSPEGIRLTTLQLRYHRYIHAEFMTHRAFSRNASSSRAIPVKNMIEELLRDPAIPTYWGSNKPGMQAGEELSGNDIDHMKQLWLLGRNNAIATAEEMIECGLHKQIANRILEPWAHINVVVTATDWDNFFELRCHPDAQPEIQTLAYQIKLELESHRPTLVGHGDWHLPYITEEDRKDVYWFAKKDRLTRDEPGKQEILTILRKVSTARCARVSYTTHDGRKTTVEEDVALHDKLVVAKPLHASPAEHVAYADTWDTMMLGWNTSKLHGNFRGWCQYRKILEL